MKELGSEAKCSTLSEESVTPFPCVAGDYSDQRWPLGTFSGFPLWLGDSCTSDSLKSASASSHIIPMVPRGGCSFRDKALILQNAGYPCAIFVDFESDSDTPITPALGDGLDIAIAMVTRRTGMKIAPQLEVDSTCDMNSVRVTVEFFRPDPVF